MKKRLIVNPERFGAAALVLFVLLTSLYCSEADDSGHDALPFHDRELMLDEWTVSYRTNQGIPRAAALSMVTMAQAEQIPEADTLHSGNEFPDSVRYSRRWFLGGGEVLVLSITAPLEPYPGQRNEAMAILEDALLEPPPGLRTVALSNRTPEEIDTQRASAPVEPPPQVFHHITVTYDPLNEDSCLVLLDSMVVDFRMSSYDSLAFFYTDANSVILSDAGRFLQTGNANGYVCYSDTSRMYTGVFQTVFAMNTVYGGHDSHTAGQARMRSAFLSGRGAFPVSETPGHYRITFRVPEDKIVWTPLVQQNDSLWVSPPGGVRGGPAIAIGSYTALDLGEGYQILLLSSDTADSLDIAAAEMLAETIRGSLHFPSAGYAFVQVSNPDRPVLVPGFGSLLFSTGSLAPAADISSWPEIIKRGGVPQGTMVVTQAAEALLCQSLQLDPVLHDILAAWAPLCYYRDHSNDPGGLVSIREAYLKYYLYGTEVLYRRGSLPTVSEHALADPALRSSPLRPLVAGGKGVAVMEYLYQLGHLDNLPRLLQNFTHASSANYWAKITTSLGLTGSKLLKDLFYLPGIPQYRVYWWQEEERIVLDVREIQPGGPFEMRLRDCVIHLADTVVTRPVITTEQGRYRCILSRSSSGSASAIDLNGDWVLPADFMYTRLNDGTGL